MSPSSPRSVDLGLQRHKLLPAMVSLMPLHAPSSENTATNRGLASLIDGLLFSDVQVTTPFSSRLPGVGCEGEAGCFESAFVDFTSDLAHDGLVVIVQIQFIPCIF